ncbi:hypothetical protein HKBW3S06_00590 [Candidatus Hakubella thermalkaliphila]|uniref:Gas vesicle protein n=1 Tax=Candidatus Hakubella thermalkaliphila TaxID=2754717 RepID=A0A6V8P2B5_9ACTN|nr:YtxH domain-containing protein [Candidatus Hakubella thermalkaliphila]GFP21364.1 hypothetical protein HKBW3S06_00590 [Candidatus Hakubella thermalkaliphila]GFP25521.1 hypothetical protein HKBW3S25_01001 [Candidatus Hakubella thermalkaliphila]
MAEYNRGLNVGFAAGVGFVLGLFAGALMGMLYTPKPGAELRRELKERGTEYYEKGKEAVDTAMEKAREGIEVGRKRVTEIAEKVAERVEDIKSAVSKAAEAGEEQAEEVKPE